MLPVMTRTWNGPSACSENSRPLVCRSTTLYTFAFSKGACPPATCGAHNIRGAVDVESHFIRVALSCVPIGMYNELMTRCIEFVADQLLTALSLSKLFDAVNPFDWMERISLQGKTDFS